MILSIFALHDERHFPYVSVACVTVHFTGENQMIQVVESVGTVQIELQVDPVVSDYDLNVQVTARDITTTGINSDRLRCLSH